MTPTLSQRVASVKPSATMALDAQVKAIKAEGRDIIGLVAGEPDFATPKHVVDAAERAMRSGHTKYTPVGGAPELVEAVQTKFRRDNALEFSAREILISSGAKQSCYNLCQALLNPGDEVVIPAPYWVSYADMARLAGGLPKIVATRPERRFLMTADELDSALGDNTRLVFLNSPNNPAGTAYSETQLAELASVLGRYPNALILADDIYEHIYWADFPFRTLLNVAPDLGHRIVTVNGVSKAYAMTGWRIGYAAGPSEVIAAMSTIQSQSTSNPCSVSQAAAIAALVGDQSELPTRAATYRNRHDRVLDAIADIQGIHAQRGDGTFYCFIDARETIARLGLSDDSALAAWLIEEAQVALVPGSAFGVSGYLRLSYATDEETLERGLGRLHAALS